MIRITCFVVIVAILAFTSLEQPPITIFLAGDSTMSVKESKAFPETGWGMPFVHFWDSTVRIVNRAKNGRSTKTFISEGIWQLIVDHIRPGDYVLIQFGHNDESVEKKERYATPDTFKMNLTKFIRETQEKGGVPILLTPVGRRKFDSNGIVQPTHIIYSALVREVAVQERTLFFDLDSASRSLYQNYGPIHSTQLFLHVAPGEHPNYPAGKEDNTHFNELGARLIAQLVWKEIVRLVPDLKERTIKPIVKN